MKKTDPEPDNVDAYIASFPASVQERLETIRQTISKVVPEAEQKISYGIPTFTLDRNIIHYAAYRNHLGLYPGSAAIAFFKKELASYRTSKGTIQLPLDAPIPCALIEKLVRYCIKNRTRPAASKRRK